MPESPDQVKVLMQRLELLEKKMALREKYRDEYFAVSFRHRADTQALLSMMQEMAVHAGLDKEHIEECFAERVCFYHDQILRNFEAANPVIASIADDRHPIEIPEEESFRPLFTSNPPEADQ